MSKLWIDVTDLHICRGSMTGIPRVVYEFALRFNNYHNASIGFFIYDDKNQYCYEVTFENLYAELYPVDSSEKQKNKLKILFSKYFKIKNQKKNENCFKDYELNFDFIRQNYNKISPFNLNDIVFVMGSTWDSLTKIRDLMNLKYSLNLKYIQIIYDLIPTFHPHLFGPGFAAQFDGLIFESIANADLLFCISKATKQELLKFSTITRIKPPLIEIIRLGDDYTQHSNPIKPKVNLADNEPFVLCLGTLEGRKNQILLYYVVKEALYKGVEIPKIIIAGRYGWLAQDLCYILKNDNMLQDKLQYVGEVTDEEKTWLYQNCSFTIYPSVFEGWGLPVAESLYYGKPCLSSIISSMPEIGGDLVDYFSPFDSGECLRKIVEYSKSEVLSTRINHIKTSYKSVPWDDAFDQVLTSIKKFTNFK